MEAARKFGIVVGVDLKCGEVDADGGGVTDGRGAAHLEVADCRPDLALRFEMEIFSFVWEFGLVDDDEGAFLFVEGEGFHVEDVGVHCMPLFIKYIMAPIPYVWSAPIGSRCSPLPPFRRGKLI